uniref:Uncharacterized protein n=2 Tax=unclassified Rosemountvirus TaxID=2738372 RepID=A0AAU8GJA7_9CAUD
MSEPSTFEIISDDGTGTVIEYRMTLANALQSWGALKKAGKLLKGIGSADIVDVDKKVDKTKAMLALVEALLENAGSAEFSDIERLVFANTIVVVNGEAKKLPTIQDHHFNANRSHILPVLQKGLVFQFAGFFSGNGLSGMAGLATLVTSGNK